MNQRTHAWIAIRAIKLLEDEGQMSTLVDLLKPYTQEASIGAWIPDKRDAKPGGAQTQNHIFKIGPFDGARKTRFVVTRKKLTNRLGPERLITGFLDKYTAILDETWWKGSYKADPSPGKHLANRAMALTINNVDMLILGDPAVQALVPGRIGFINQVPGNVRCSAGQAAIFFFMLSHFIADALMPCHCDDRDLSDYDNGLHMELEGHWSHEVGTYFEDDNLIRPGLNDDDILKQAASVDGKFGINFQNRVPNLGSDDIWEEMVLLCRASFALASIIAPHDKYPYKPGPQVMAPFDSLFAQNQQGRDLLSEIDRVIMSDAVLNVAAVWKHIWTRFH
jgi:hypothetical protein